LPPRHLREAIRAPVLMSFVQPPSRPCLSLKRSRFAVFGIHAAPTTFSTLQQ